MMTKKDFIAIAASFKRLIISCPHDNRDDRNRFRGFYDSMVAVANALATDNPRFDKARFLCACGHPGWDLET
jgi:hypothetical protein